MKMNYRAHKIGPGAYGSSVIVALIAAGLVCLLVTAIQFNSLDAPVELGKDVGQYFGGPPFNRPMARGPFPPDSPTLRLVPRQHENRGRFPINGKTASAAQKPIKSLDP